MNPYYADDYVTLYHGEALDVLRQLPDASADVVLTDPPYSSGGMFSSARQNDPASKYRSGGPDSTGKWVAPKTDYGTFGGDSRDQRSFTSWVGAWSFQALRATRPGGAIFCFTDWRQLPVTTDAIQHGGWIWRGINVWDKGRARPMRGMFRNTLEYVVWGSNGSVSSNEPTAYPSALVSVPAVGSDEREHVTQKPVELLVSLLGVVGHTPLTVLDPFIGSGSTLIAARQLGHKCIGIEIDERYCEMAARRLSAQQPSLFDSVTPITTADDPAPAFDFDNWDAEVGKA